MTQSILLIQNEMIREISELNGDLEKIMILMIRLGRQLPPMPEADKTNQNLIRGCQSKVWLKAWTEEDNLYFLADSNTAITKGLIGLLIRIFNGQPVHVIIESDLHFVKNTGLERFIGNQRSNGLASMIQQMKSYAQAHHSAGTAAH